MSDNIVRGCIYLFSFLINIIDNTIDAYIDDPSRMIRVAIGSLFGSDEYMANIPTNESNKPININDKCLFVSHLSIFFVQLLEMVDIIKNCSADNGATTRGIEYGVGQLLMIRGINILLIEDVIIETIVNIKSIIL